MGGPPQKRPRNLEISEFFPKGASPQRSDGHLGEAEGVDQTFLEVTGSDGQLSTSEPFNLTINPVNDAPTAADDSLGSGASRIYEGSEFIIEVTNLLANDSESDSICVE